jgi:DNA (cytosine-5)-methyltransferase 1
MGDELKLLDLFSGIGGFSLGLERAGMKTIAFCEFDKHAQKVLSKHWPEVEIHEDIRELDAKEYRGSVDIVCGGFPCQDLSQAGAQKGFDGERSSLYREMLRVISECLPKYAIFENVSGLLTGDNGRWFSDFLYDLAAIGYDAEWHCIKADLLGIPTHRDRVWVLAYPAETNVAQVVDEGRLSSELGRMGAAHLSRTGWAVDQRRMGRGVDGVPDETHRFEQLGNSVLPQIPEAIGRAIMEQSNDIRDANRIP